MDEILRALEGMQVSDANKVAMPAQWPNNSRFGSRVIIPPASNVEDAKDRIVKAAAGEHECLDWWLCHKELK